MRLRKVEDVERVKPILRQGLGWEFGILKRAAVLGSRTISSPSSARREDSRLGFAASHHHFFVSSDPIRRHERRRKKSKRNTDKFGKMMSSGYTSLDNQKVSGSVPVRSLFHHHPCPILSLLHVNLSDLIGIASFFQAVASPEHVSVKFTESNLQTFPPSSETQGKIAGGYRPPKDADAEDLSSMFAKASKMGLIEQFNACGSETQIIAHLRH
ncbi:hypothetical protein ACLOJK_026001 [Asimina triloba]